MHRQVIGMVRHCREVHMKQNPHFCLIKIGTEHYLVPFGQDIANMRPSLRMNEASSFLWEKLSECTDEKELVFALAREYEVPEGELPKITKDVRTMLRQFFAVGAVRNDYPRQGGVSENSRSYAFSLEKWNALLDREPWYRDMVIGGLVIRLYGSADYFSDLFGDFYIRESAKPGADLATDGTSKNNGQDLNRMQEAAFYNGPIYDRTADIDIIVTEETPPETEELPILIKGMTVTVLDGGRFYVIRTTEAPVIREGHILKDGSRAVLFMAADGKEDGTDPDQESNRTADSLNYSAFEKENETEPEEERTPADAVFHMIRHVFMICAEKRDMYIIHSASILHNGRAWLFSALSGTGKSTHTNIWHKLYGTPYLDGDLNLLAFEGGQPVVMGIPWCGTSGIYTTETWPLGGIILLARNPKNYVEELPLGAKVLGISMRFISPKWDEEMLKGVLDFSERIAESAKIARLHCNMEDEAAEVCRRWVEDTGEENVLV